MSQPENSSVSLGLFFSIIAVLLLGAAVGGYFVWDAMDALSLEQRNLERKLAAAESKNASLERENEDLANKNAAAKKDVQAARKDLAAANKAAESARRELKDLQSAKPSPQAAAPERDCAGLAGELKDAREQNAALTARLEAAGARAEPSKECADLREQNANLAARIEAAKSETADAAAKVAACQSSLDALRQKREQEELAAKADYDKIVANLEDEVRDKEIVITRIKERLELTMLDGVLFRFGSSRITPQGRKILAAVAGELANIGDRRIYVIGHTDDVPVRADYQGTFRDNWQLSADRAASVAAFLSKTSGVDPSRFSIVGRSFYQPAAPNDAPEGRAKNRRVEIVIGALDL